MPSQGLGSTTGLELTVRLERLICPGDFLSAQCFLCITLYVRTYANFTAEVSSCSKRWTAVEVN